MENYEIIEKIIERALEINKSRGDKEKEIIDFTKRLIKKKGEK